MVRNNSFFGKAPDADKVTPFLFGRNTDTEIPGDPWWRGRRDPTRIPSLQLAQLPWSVGNCRADARGYDESSTIDINGCWKQQSAARAGLVRQAIAYSDGRSG